LPLKETTLLRGEGGGGNDDAVEGKQRQSLIVEDCQNFIESAQHLARVRRIELRPARMQQLDLLQQIANHIGPLLSGDGY